MASPAWTSGGNIWKPREFSPGRTICDRGSPATQVPRPSSGFRHHDDRDLHGIRPRPLSPAPGAGCAPGPLHGHDLPVRPEVPRSAGISCRPGNDSREVVCEATLAVQENSPAGRLAEPLHPALRSQVLLGGGRGRARRVVSGFPVRPDELRAPPVNHEQVLKSSDGTGLGGRYRVLEAIDGAPPL